MANDKARLMRNVIGLVPTVIEDPPRVQEELIRLGCRHSIYGVEEFDFETFSAALVNALRTLLGRDGLSEAAYAAWKRTLASMCEVMSEAAKTISQTPVKLPLHRWKKNNKWKSSALGLALHNINVYDDEKVR